MKPIFKLLFFISIIIQFSCANSSGIFPSVSTSTAENSVLLANPIDLVIDQTNSQIIIANSNFDVYVETGSLAVLTVDASSPSAPELSATQILPTDNFAGRMHFDGTNLIIPFRESFPTDDSVDIINKYTVGSGSVTLDSTNSIAANPYGIDFDGTNFFVISDDKFVEIDSNLQTLNTIDLTVAENNDLTSSDSSFVLEVAYDSTNDRAFVSNNNGRIFVVDTNQNEVDYVISGIELSRGLLIHQNNLYVADTNSNAIWVLNLNDLEDTTSGPIEIDDSGISTQTISVGSTPANMALDATNNRLYVTNSNEDSISVIDTNINQEIHRIQVGTDDLTNFNRGVTQPYGLKLGTFNGTQYLFVTGLTSSSIAMIHTQSLNVVEVYPNTVE